jgi:hypothetical protein
MILNDNNLEVVDDIEVILSPDFYSESPHEILGCPASADPEEIDRRYRDLSRKYHPDRSSPENSKVYSVIFQRIGEAHARITGNEEDLPVTPEAAKQAYESKYGKYRDLYYTEAGIIGLPYSIDLKERFLATTNCRDTLSLQLCRFGNSRLQIVFFRQWLMKKDMGFLFWFLEILFTWTVISLCECLQCPRFGFLRFLISN